MPWKNPWGPQFLHCDFNRPPGEGNVQDWLDIQLLTPLSHRAVASLTVLGGQEFHFPHFSSKFDEFSYFSSNFTYLLPHFGPPGGRVAHPGRPWLRHCFHISKLALIIISIVVFFFFVCVFLFFFSKTEIRDSGRSLSIFGKYRLGIGTTIAFSTDLEHCLPKETIYDICEWYTEFINKIF